MKKAVSTGTISDAISAHAEATQHRDGLTLPFRRRPLAFLGSSSLLALGLAAVGAPTPAQAACVTIGGCYGAYHVTGTDTFYPGTASVQQVETDAGAGGLNLTIPGSVQGAQTGIFAVNTNNGAIDLTANGNATGVINYGYGILAVNSDKVTFTPDGTVSTVSSTSMATDLSVEANGRVFGGNAGIYAQNLGSGTTVVTANGEVSSTNFAVDVSNGANGTDIVVNTLALNGGYGVRAVNSGTGDTSITTNGLVEAMGVGMSATNGGTAHALTVEANAVSSGSIGISAVNFGIGATQVTARDAVTASGFGGIVATNGATATDLTVQADANVSGGDAGVWAENRGTGATHVTVKGQVTATGFGPEGYGVVTTNGLISWDNPTGTITKVVGPYGNGVTAETAGVIGGGTGIFAVNTGAGVTSVNASGDAIGTQTYGILAINADQVTFNADGTVASLSATSTASDLLVTAKDVGGGVSGIYAYNRGNGVTSIDAGAVTGNGAYGIQANGYGTAVFVSAGAVSGGVFGISVSNFGAGPTYAQATGSVTAGETGVDVFAGSLANATLLVQATDVSAGTTGIRAVNRGTAATRVIISGDVTGTNGYGVMAVNGNVTNKSDGTINQITGPTGTDLTVNVAGVKGGKTGIVAVNTGTGATSVHASGNVESDGAYGIVTVAARSVMFNQDGAAVNAAAGTGTDLSVTADAGVSGGAAGTGIYANNQGTGRTSVTVNGDVAGGRDGIIASVGGTGGDLRIMTGAGVSGGLLGINVLNFGIGATEVTAAGAVSGGDIGIYAEIGSNTKGITINAAAVSGTAYGISVTNEGTGKTAITAMGAVTAARDAANPNAGIFAYAQQTTAGGLTIDAQNVSGTYGILANNAGAGVTSVTAQDVSGIYGGVIVGNSRITRNEFLTNPLVNSGNSNPNATDIVVKTGAVNVGSNGAFSAGIDVTNNGTGKTVLTATGDVTADYVGIYAINNDHATDLTVSATGVNGGAAAIAAFNYGTGKTSVRATGDVSGGILAFNDTQTTDLAVETDAKVSGTSGIFAFNDGTGRTSITATGDVKASLDLANTGAGILAYAGQTTVGGLSIDAKNVSGPVGIAANNSGAGITSVTAGNVSGATYGVIVGNGVVDPNDVGNEPVALAFGNSNPNATDIVVKTGAVTLSGDNSVGIAALNHGTGKTSVTATGDVSAGATGIAAGNISGTDLTVTAAGVNGGTAGITALNYGTGKTSVTATGTVTGGRGIGIEAINLGTDLTVTAAGVGGGTYGISATNVGAGTTGVTVSGAVQGGTAGIYVDGVAPATVTIAATGAVRNASGLASDLAVQATGASVFVSNAGQLTGRVLFDGNATLSNSGIWLTSGVSDFGPGNDRLVNAGSGIIRATGMTRFDNLGTFTNSGVVTMQNSTAGNRIATPANVTLAAGSTLGVDINTAGAADGIDTTGTADISGTRLDVSAQGVRAGRYTIVTAAGGLDGIFGSVTGIASAFAGFTDVYDANDAYLDVFRARDFADAGLTPNQKAAAAGIQSTSGNDPFFAGNSLYNAVLGLPTDAAARAAFDLASGEIHASVKTALIDDSRFVRNAAIDRIRSAFSAVGAAPSQAMAFADPGNIGSALAYAAPARAPLFAPARADIAEPVLWGQAFGSWGHVDGDGNAARLSHETGGLVTGGDMVVLETWRLGLMGGYSRTDFKVNDRASSGISDNYHIGVYGGTQSGPIGLRLGAAYTWHDITTNRSVVFPSFGDTLRGDYNAGTTQVFGELGYGIRAGNFGFEPFVNAAYVRLHANDLNEKGGVAALHGDGGNTTVTFSTLGLHLSSDVMLGSVAATARGTLGWRHAFGDTTPLATLSLAGGLPFTVAGVPVAADAAVFDAGLSFAITRNATVGIVYNSQIGNRAMDQSLKGNFEIRF